jgi:hypothetical protein
MKKYEYKWVDASMSVKDLNVLGLDGWRVVHTGQDDWVLVEREIPPVAGEAGR